METSKKKKKYSIPFGPKLAGAIMFVLTFTLTLFMPVFELIPESKMTEVFKTAGVIYPHESVRVNVFEMMAYDYNSAVMVIMVGVFGILAILGIVFLMVNKPKAAIVPAAALVLLTFFTFLRSPDFLTADGSAQLASALKSGSLDTIAISSTGYFSLYATATGNYVYNILPAYPWLWVAVLATLVVAIVAFVKSTETTIEVEE